jgi:hypothetical protein
MRVQTRVGIRFAAPTAWLALLLVTGCSNDPYGPPRGLASCDGSAPLTITPVPVGAINEIAPLGSVFPPGHTTPAAHIYFYFAPSGQVNKTPVPLVAPGNVVISEVLRATRTGGGQPAFVDYTLTFFPCAELRLYFAHVTTLDSDLARQIGSLDGNCSTSSTAGFTYVSCIKETNITVAAATPLGTVSGPGQGALDLGAADRRKPPLAFVNPSRPHAPGGPPWKNHTVCAVDYFTSPVRDMLRSLFGRGVRRTAEPVCGQLMQDVPGSAQGRWYMGSSDMDDRNLALVHDNVIPTLAAFSVGTAVPSLPSRVYRFTPDAAGRVNTDFHLVNAVGTIHCYDATNVANQLILIQLVSATRLRIEGQAGTSCGAPESWAFTAGAVTFDR